MKKRLKHILFFSTIALITIFVIGCASDLQEKNRPSMEQPSRSFQPLTPCVQKQGTMEWCFTISSSKRMQELCYYDANTCNSDLEHTVGKVKKCMNQQARNNREECVERIMSPVAAPEECLSLLDEFKASYCLGGYAGQNEAIGVCSQSKNTDACYLAYAEYGGSDKQVCNLISDLSKKRKCLSMFRE